MVLRLEKLRKYGGMPVIALTLVVLCALGLLAACTQSMAPAAASNGDSAAATVDAAAVDAAAVDAAAVDAVVLRAAPDSITEDFTLIGQTGRPQFLNSFADW
ncbi:MAG: hypothetical protein R3A44_04505 [Caldilineaceae bacterium]